MPKTAEGHARWLAIYKRLGQPAEHTISSSRRGALCTCATCTEFMKEYLNRKAGKAEGENNERDRHE